MAVDYFFSLGIFSSTIFQHGRLSSAMKLIPKPTTQIPDVAAFLNQAGRNLAEHAEIFPTWEALFQSNGSSLKQAGIDVQSRRYLLKQLEHYRQSGTLGVYTPGVKLNGGERKFNEFIGKKRVLDRIKLQQSQKMFKKEDNLMRVKESKWAKLYHQEI